MVIVSVTVAVDRGGSDCLCKSSIVYRRPWRCRLNRRRFRSCIVCRSYWRCRLNRRRSRSSIVYRRSDVAYRRIYGLSIVGGSMLYWIFFRRWRWRRRVLSCVRIHLLTCASMIHCGMYRKRNKLCAVGLVKMGSFNAKEQAKTELKTRGPNIESLKISTKH